MKVLIVDDEPLAREGLRMLLTSDPDVVTIREAKDGREAVESIRSERPDLVLLDVQMPEMDGLRVVCEVGPARMPAVVFVTAHDQYAIEAFEINAIDYLLKPVTAQRLVQAMERAKSRLSEDSSKRMLSLLERLAAPKKYLQRVAVRSLGKTVFVNLEDVEWMRAAENYVELHAGQSVQLLQVTMSTMEKSLDPEAFVRVHRSLIVNVRRIREIQPSAHGEYVVVLTNGVRLQSGRSYHERIRALMTNPF